MNENIEITENGALGLLIALASAMSEQGNCGPLLRRVDYWVDNMATNYAPIATPMWNPKPQDLRSIHSMRQWLNDTVSAGWSLPS